MHDIFLSYSRADNHIMQKVKQTLKEAAFTVWTDEGIEPGTHDWRMAIENAIQDTQCLVCICSPEAKQSRWVQAEINRAEKRNKHIYLILLRGNELDSIPFGYDFHQFTDIRDINHYQQAMTKLIGNIKSKIKNDAPESEKPIVVSKPEIRATTPKFSSSHKEAANLEAELQSTLNRVKSLMPKPFDWCYIPAGNVTLEAGGYVPEGGETYHVEAFYMAKYPVTNRQYAEFIGAGGYRTEAYWTEEGWELCQKSKWTQPGYFQSSKFNLPTHPVVGVSWFEAIAFCNWLNILKRDDSIECKLTLPTEQQWQHAGQGDDRRKFPWGDTWTKDKGNCSNLVGKTSPVTQYPDGASPYGVFDMSGNVWEWCLTAWESASDDLNKMDLTYVLRGGSWLDDASIARSASRLNHSPYLRNLNRGFRACVAPARSAIEI